MMWHAWMSMQIILEMIPISSSAHLVILQSLYERIWQKPLLFPVKSHLVDSFFEVIQAPTIVLIALYFSSRWVALLCSVRRTYFLLARSMCLALVADVVTCGFFIGIKHYQLFSIPLWVGFLITMLVLLRIRKLSISVRANWNLKDALILGAAQGIALLPGISRLAITFAAALWRGIAPKQAFEIAWLIEIPLISAACLKSIVLHHNEFDWGQLLSPASSISMLISSIIAWYCLKWVAHQAYRKNMDGFAWYMILPILYALMLV